MAHARCTPDMQAHHAQPHTIQAAAHTAIAAATPLTQAASISALDALHIQPPQIKTSASGTPYLPSFPLYARSLLRAAHVRVSPASASLLHYALYFAYRSEGTRALHLLHLLYIKLLYVRMREEERRRSAEADATLATVDVPPALFSNAALSAEEQELAQRLRSIPIEPRTTSPKIRSQRSTTRVAALPDALNIDTSSPAAASTLTVAASSSDAQAEPAVHAPSRSPSCVAVLTRAGSESLRYPFTLFASLFSRFAEAAAVAYASVAWDHVELFLRANAQPRADKDSLTSAASGHVGTGTMMDHQAALAAALEPHAASAHYAHAAADADELAVLDILRSDKDLLHYPIDWPLMLMLTHEAYQQHLQQLQAAQDEASSVLATTAQLSVGAIGREHILPPGYSAAPGAYSSQPLVSPTTTTAAISPQKPCVSDVVLQVLQQWRAQKRAEQKEERRRNGNAASSAAAATSSSAEVSAAAGDSLPPLSGSSATTSAADDICYVPITAKHRLDRNTSEYSLPYTASASASASAGATSSTVSPSSAAVSPTRPLRKPLTAAARRWRLVLDELHKRRLLRLLRAQREFYLALAKHKVLTHHSTPSSSTRNVRTQSHVSTPVHGGPHAASLMSFPHSVSVPSLVMMNAGAGASKNGSTGGAGSAVLSTTSSTATTPVLAPVPSPASSTVTLGEYSLSSFSPSADHMFSPPPPPPPPRRPVVVLMAGGMSAGKSTVLASLRGAGGSNLFGISSDRAVLIEADAFKLVDPLFQSLPSSDPSRSQLVHSQSLATAEETLLAALRAGRDIILDGTGSWRPYVAQTIAMIRRAHTAQFARGPGFKVDPSNGTVTEEYWREVAPTSPTEHHAPVRGERVETAARLGEGFMFSPSPGPSSDDDERAVAPYPCMSPPAGADHPFPLPQPYIVCMLGVTVSVEVACSRSIRRAISSGRAVPMDKMLSSYSMYAANFDAVAALVDALMLFDNSADAEGALLRREGASQPTLVAARSLGEASVRIEHQALWDEFRAQATLPTDACCADDMLQRIVQTRGESVAAAMRETVYPSLSDALPPRLRWLLSQQGGDDDIIQADGEDDEDEAE